MSANTGYGAKLRAPLPVRDGVGPSRTCVKAGKWTTLAQYLIECFPATPAHEWMRRIAEREVVDRNGLVVTIDRPHEAGLVLFYYRTLESEDRIPFDEDILFHDDHLVVADKPHFLPVIPSGRYLQETLLVRLKRRLGIDSLVPIHRVDRDTAGVVLFSVQERTRDLYQALFRDRAVEKSYEAVAPVNDRLNLPLTYMSRIVPDTHFMRMREVPGPPNATTHIALINRVAAAGGFDQGLYRLAPITGRKHQLRVQCAALAIPILNDPIYPELREERPQGEAAAYAKPLQLLAREIAFRDPLTNCERRFTSRLTLESSVPAL